LLANAGGNKNGSERSEWAFIVCSPHPWDRRRQSLLSLLSKASGSENDPVRSAGFDSFAAPAEYNPYLFVVVLASLGFDLFASPYQ